MRILAPTPAGESSVAPRVGRHTEPVHGALRHSLLFWSAACLALFGLLGLLVSRDRNPLASFDSLGKRATHWAEDHHSIVEVLHWVEVLTAGRRLLVLTLLLAAWLLWRRRPRAGLYAVAVMLSAMLASTALKVVFARARPEWQASLMNPLNTDSFPSGHVTSMSAFAGVVVVVTWTISRRGMVRRTVLVLAVAMWAVVCLDRVLLGRHYPSDLIGGTLLGVGLAVLWLAILDPSPRGSLPPGPS